MNEWYDRASKKLETEKRAGKFGRHANVMKDAVCEALDSFCKQDEEFAEAVVQGGSFEACMETVAKGCGSALSDLEAFRRAVRFYFPGADVRFHMSVNLCADVEGGEPPEERRAESKILDLEDFL